MKLGSNKKIVGEIIYYSKTFLETDTVEQSKSFNFRVVRTEDFLLTCI